MYQDKEQEKIFLSTHCGLEILKAQLEKGKDLSPENKKLYKTVTELSYYFRYRWEQQKAENEACEWRGSAWEVLKRVKEELLPRKSSKKPQVTLITMKE